MKASVEHVYTSVACNRIPEIVDWNKDGLICYGATNAVLIYNTRVQVKDPLTVLSFHRKRVNFVKWVYKPDGSCTELISCSADKTVAIWSHIDGTWRVTSVITGHSDGVTSASALYTSDNELTVYTGSIDSTVRVWTRINGIIMLNQIITLNSGLCLTLVAHLLPIANKPILICALDDHKIHIFAKDSDYQRVHTLVGHEDWVRGLDVMDVDDTTILLASASQDTYIRLWRIQHHTTSDTGPTIKVEEKVFHAYGYEWSVKLDAVLAGHEGWVYGVQWQPGIVDKVTKRRQPIYRLLSSSLDKTVIIWEPESEGDGAWVERVRVGEVGGNGLGFYGSKFGPDGTSFLGHGYNGSFHMWSLNEETKQWSPQVVCGGHFGAVEDLRWDSLGRYVASVSADQTTRLHAPWITSDGVAGWHEIARPQVHGYDLAAVALVSSDVFASAAEEKVIRVFQAPHNFRTNFRNIVGEALVDDESKGPEGASVPSLGLSNKAVYTAGEDKTELDENDAYFTPVELHEPPTEETLMQNTLWPETHKLYGHGYEVFALDASPDGTLLASACKATVPEHAAVLIWDTSTWQQIQKLVSHTLTVTRLAFSPDSRRLLSVSRDRRWTLSQRADDNSFSIVGSTDKSNGIHSRIVWSCCWAPDSTAFATGSRDGKVCVWSETDVMSDTSLKKYALCGKPLELQNSSVTSLAFAPTNGATRIIAVGLESGAISIYGFDGVWDLLIELDNSAAHHLTVKILAFRPQQARDKELLLASCGTDHLVRIYSVQVTC